MQDTKTSKSQLRAGVRDAAVRKAYAKPELKKGPRLERVTANPKASPNDV